MRASAGEEKVSVGQLVDEVHTTVNWSTYDLGEVSILSFF